MKQLKPTKACDVQDTATLKYPLLSSIKYDGCYALNIEGKLLGRSLKPFKNKFITQELSKPLYEGFCGELCEVDTDTSLARQDLCRNTTSRVNTIEKEWNYKWMLFDYSHPDVIHLGYADRMNALKQKVYDLKLDNIEIVELISVYGSEQADELYQEYLDNGYEGLILRSPDGKWKDGRSTLREQLFLRMKPQSDAEAVVIGVQEALTNNNKAKTNELGYTERSSHRENKIGNGMLGAFLCIDLMSGMEITVGAGKLTHKERKNYFDNPPLHQLIKYRSMNTGVKDLPRFPRFYSFRAIEDMDEILVVKYNKLMEGWSG